jgi:hypothetical protein
MPTRDLFDIFPDLPRPGRKNVQERVAEIRERAVQVQREFRSKAARKRAAAERWRDEWKKRSGS